MAEKQELFKIGDATQILGVTPRTLRFYEEEGLVEPVRTAKGTRLYARDDIERLQAVQLMAAAGVPLQTIKVLCALRKQSRTGGEASQAVLDAMEEIREAAVEKIRLYQRLLKELEQAGRKISECSGCGLRPTPANCTACPDVSGLDQPVLMKLLIGHSGTQRIS